MHENCCRLTYHKAKFGVKIHEKSGKVTYSSIKLPWLRLEYPKITIKHPNYEIRRRNKKVLNHLPIPCGSTRATSDSIQSWTSCCKTRTGRASRQCGCASAGSNLRPREDKKTLSETVWFDLKVCVSLDWLDCSLSFQRILNRVVFIVGREREQH